MAWEWSHTVEAYQAAEKNLRKMNKRRLGEIYAEWKSTDLNDNEMDLDNYEKLVLETKIMNREELADFIWEKAEEQRTCTNGGHEAYMCPHGCKTHLVSFGG